MLTLHCHCLSISSVKYNWELLIIGNKLCYDVTKGIKKSVISKISVFWRRVNFFFFHKWSREAASLETQTSGNEYKPLDHVQCLLQLIRQLILCFASTAGLFVKPLPCLPCLFFFSFLRCSTIVLCHSALGTHSLRAQSTDRIWLKCVTHQRWLKACRDWRDFSTEL